VAAPVRHARVTQRCPGFPGAPQAGRVPPAIFHSSSQKPELGKFAGKPER